MLSIYFALQAVVAAPVTPLAQGQTGPLLWKDLRVGMSPEQVAVTLRSVEGVAQVEVKRNRKAKFKSLSINYTTDGVRVGDLRVSVLPEFTDEHLTELNLTASECASAATVRLGTLRESLNAKYGNMAREKVVDENGVEIEKRGAFWNTDTRVRLSWQLNAPPSEYYAGGGGGVQGALAGLANLANQTSRDAALKACPSDQGVKVQTTINYSSQSEFLRTNTADIQARDAKAKATRDAL